MFHRIVSGTLALAAFYVLAACSNATTAVPTPAVRSQHVVSRLTAAYKTVDLSVAGYPESNLSAAIMGSQGGTFTVAYYKWKCGPRYYCTTSQTHAAIWNGTRQSVVDLNPSGYFQTAVNGLATGVQVGYGYASQPTYRQQYHALLWRGSAGSMVDLHPAGYNGSIAYAADGNVQAGSAWTSGIGSHAVIWSGSASSVVDLNPPGTTGSEAYAVSNDIEGGYAMLQGLGQHAYVWTGTASSGRDVHPSAYQASYIKGVDGKTEVGAVATASGWHAFLWVTGSSGVNLEPPNSVQSEAVAAYQGTQVGWVGSASSYHAAAWSGTAQSFVDLHQFLPSGFVGSKAAAIASDGSIAGFAQDSNWKMHAILWVPQH